MSFYNADLEKVKPAGGVHLHLYFIKDVEVFDNIDGNRFKLGSKIPAQMI